MHPNSIKNLTINGAKYRYKKGDKHTDKWKENHRKLMTENNPFKGKKHSEATKIIMAEKARLRTGEKANNWKGGMSPLRVAIKKTFEYRQWRSDIFGRDNWTCQDCNKKSRKIEAHHIIYLAIIIKEYGLKNIIEARECEKLWDINNGVTLCKECHKKRHKL